MINLNLNITPEDFGRDNYTAIDSVAVEMLTPQPIAVKDLPLFKCRASALSKITAARGLGKTGQSYCEQWLKETITGTQQHLNSPAVRKGNELEEAGIAVVAEYIGMHLEKNEQRFEDDFFTGTPDIRIGKWVAIDDLKLSQSLDSHPMFATEAKTEYWAQGQVYMQLTGARIYCVTHVLMTTPEHLRRTQEQYPEDWIDYDQLPIWQRVNRIQVKRDDDYIALAKERVVECRRYVAKLIVAKYGEEQLPEYYKEYL